MIATQRAESGIISFVEMKNNANALFHSFIKNNEKNCGQSTTKFQKKNLNTAREPLKHKTLVPAPNDATNRRSGLPVDSQCIQSIGTNSRHPPQTQNAAQSRQTCKQTSNSEDKQ